MNRLFLIFNHTLTEEQEKEAREVLGVEEIISLPQDLQNFWSNIPPDVDLNEEMFKPIVSFLSRNKSQNLNYCLIQGDFGATVYLVSWCFKNGFIPIYATTKRTAQEVIKPDGSVELIKIFKHERFRRYILCS
ncbi:CRISPR-associated protein Csx20 [Caldicellulosiruptor naganoensis]|uniref:CRISPR-associated protein Csx20 n=1 Tax=Caldicellulosiruptor naganoensis TaxID=29324 RepID=A0ABY7BFM0_9FIRM|nr:CRISPR-associated protein Csx20 [Caldicellulosiruptor naganoensis]WAM31609.1 CRISPR-associated protein Csx20 [Caldicellulosiruptor naganoensis]